MLLRVGSTIIKVDDQLEDQVLAPVSCATATVAACYRQIGNVAGKRVLIFGAGMLGVTASAFAAAHGAADVVIVDRDADRLLTANRFGATHTIPWRNDSSELIAMLEDRTQGNRFCVVIELSGNPDAVQIAFQAAGVGGRVVLAGSVMPSPPVSVDPETIVRGCLAVFGVHNYAPIDLQTAVHFLQRWHGEYPFASLVARTDSLQDVNKSFQFAIRQRPVRIAVRP
jgi:alcohol dehydrogenase